MVAEVLLKRSENYASLHKLCQILCKHNLQKPTPNVRDAKWQNIFEINSLFDEKEKKHVD